MTTPNASDRGPVSAAASASFSYGPDLSGLVCAFLFTAHSTAVALDARAASEWLERADHAGGEFLWLHLNLASAASEKWLKERTSLDDQFYEALHEGSRSSRIEVGGDSLIAVVNDVLHDFSFDPSDIATLWLHVDRRLVVSGRKKPLRSVDRLRHAVKRGEAVPSPVALLVHLLRDQGDVLIGIVRNITTRVDDIEDNLLAGRLNHKRHKLGELRRVLVRLQRLLAPEPGALFRLLQRPPSWIAEDDVLELRQSTEEFSVVLNDIAAAQERIKLLQEEIAAHVNEQTNRSLFVLTTVTVLALPINLVAALFGMNVGGVPLQQADGFWTIVGLVAAVTVSAGWFAFRRQRRDL